MNLNLDREEEKQHLGAFVNQADPPTPAQCVFQFLFYFSVLLPEDIGVWTINDRGLHTRTVEHKPSRAAEMV